jgi:transposase
MYAMNLLPEYEGISVCDALESYARYTCEHALCNAHHLREQEFITEGYGRIWAEEMSILLRNLKQLVAQAKVQGETALWEKLVQWFENHYHTLIAAFLAANPLPNPPLNAAKSRGCPKRTLAKKLLDHLQQHQAQVLAFIYDFRLPFDNNQPEQDLPMMKLKQKISVGFRSVARAQMFRRIRGYISILKKQRLNVQRSTGASFLR